MEERFNTKLAETRGPVSDSQTENLNGTPALPRLAYSLQETAQMLGVCDKTVRRLIARRLLKPLTALRHILIPKSEIERFLRETQAPQK